jgi:hypothetical protein
MGSDEALPAKSSVGQPRHFVIGKLQGHATDAAVVARGEFDVFVVTPTDQHRVPVADS